MHAVEGHAGLPLGAGDGGPDRLLGLVEIDDDAGLDAARTLVAQPSRRGALAAVAIRQQIFDVPMSSTPMLS
jgi:hypothetical protein